jgi:hypothetical protein
MLEEARRSNIYTQAGIHPQGHRHGRWLQLHTSTVLRPEGFLWWLVCGLVVACFSFRWSSGSARRAFWRLRQADGTLEVRGKKKDILYRYKGKRFTTYT